MPDLRSARRSGLGRTERDATVDRGSPVTLLADSFNVASGWRHLPVPEERFVLEAGQRLVCRLSAPADEITLNGTLVFDEIGKPA